LDAVTCGRTDEWTRLNQYVPYLLTHSLHDAGYPFDSRHSLSLSNKSLLCLWNPKVHYRAHKSPPTGPYPEPAESNLPHRYYFRNTPKNLN